MAGSYQDYQLVKDELQDSIGAESQEPVSRRGDDRMLFQDSCPNYAKINHFEEGASPAKQKPVEEEQQQP